jgi:hypothetical protein
MNQVAETPLQDGRDSARDGDMTIQQTESVNSQEERPAAEAGFRDESHRSDFYACLIATASIVPVVAAVITVTMWKFPLVPYWIPVLTHPLGTATVNLLLAWACLSGLYYFLGFSSADRANAGSYSALRDRLRELQARCSQRYGVPSAESVEECSECFIRRVALQEACAHKTAIERDLAGKGPRWALGLGYVFLWKRMHNADEALILAEPREAVIAGARYDEMRCEGSTIDNSDKFQERVRYAIEFLRDLPPGFWHEHPRLDRGAKEGEAAPLAAAPVKASDAVAEPVSKDGNPTPQDPEPARDAVKPSEIPKSEAEARSDLRQVRRAVNEFRSDRWAGLVRARNMLAVATGLTGLAVYALLWLAIVEGASGETIASATAFFLIGAMVGLFNQCYSDSRATTVVDDYGLSLARLMVTPLISGVAAVGGVVIVAMLSITSISQAATGFGGGEMSVADLFDVRKSPLNMVVAATFGLTPGLLLERLRAQTERYKSDLRTTQAAETFKR